MNSAWAEVAGKASTVNAAVRIAAFALRNIMIVVPSHSVFVFDCRLNISNNPAGCKKINGYFLFKRSETFSLQMATGDQGETDRYWNASIGNGGRRERLTAAGSGYCSAATSCSATVPVVTNCCTTDATVGSPPILRCPRPFADQTPPAA